MVGSHLAEYLLGLGGVEVYGLYRWRSKMDNLEELRQASLLHYLDPSADDPASAKGLHLVEGDLTDPYAMQRAVAAVRPDRVFHLAAQSFVPASWRAPHQTLATNVLGQVHLLEAIRELGLDPIIHVAGSSEEYGEVRPEEVPIKESNPLRPLSPYAVSKVAQEMLAWQYHRSYGLRCVVTRGFNHTGPRRGEVFVTSNFAKQIAQVEKGLRPPVLYVGDLSVRRDWSDVRDVVRAYWLVTEHGLPGEVYNIGSGQAREVREVLELLVHLSGTSIQIQEDPARFRPSDVRLLVGDITKFKSLTGWELCIPFEQTMLDLLNYWRARV